MALNLSFLKKASFWSHLGALATGVAAGVASGAKPLAIVINAVTTLLGGN